MSASGQVHITASNTSHRERLVCECLLKDSNCLAVKWRFSIRCYHVVIRPAKKLFCLLLISSIIKICCECRILLQLFAEFELRCRGSLCCRFDLYISVYATVGQPAIQCLTAIVCIENSILRGWQCFEIIQLTENRLSIDKFVSQSHSDFFYSYSNLYTICLKCVEIIHTKWQKYAFHSNLFIFSKCDVLNFRKIGHFISQ